MPHRWHREATVLAAAGSAHTVIATHDPTPVEASAPKPRRRRGAAFAGAAFDAGEDGEELDADGRGLRYVSSDSEPEVGEVENITSISYTGWYYLCLKV